MITPVGAIAGIEVHPSAVVHPSARLGPGTRVGPHAVIGEGVVLGEECEVGPGAHLVKWVEAGARNRFHSGEKRGELRPPAGGQQMIIRHLLVSPTAFTVKVARAIRWHG